MFQDRIVVVSPLGAGALTFERMITVEEVGRPFSFALEVLCERADLDARELLGRSASVTVQLAAGGARSWNGVVTRFQHAGRTTDRARYRLTLEPRLSTLAHRTNCRIFQDVTAPEVIETILREHAVPHRLALGGPHRRREYLVQYRESDLTLVSRLMEEEGIYYYFAHDEADHTMVLVDPPASLDPLPGYAAIPYYPPDPDHPRLTEHLDQWGRSWQVRSGAYATVDFNFTGPSTDLGARLQLQPVDHPHAAHERFDYPGPHTTAGEGQDLARVRMEELQAQVEVAHGEGTAAGLAAGSVITLVDGLGLGGPAGKYFLTGVRHTLTVNAAPRSGGDGQVSCRCVLDALDARLPFRSPAITARPLVGGPQTAIVVGRAGEEIWTDRYGRIKVQFHWDREGTRDEDSSCWVRLGNPWAGSGFGFQQIPRVGQEVIVDFLEGDPDRPIITGSVYNADNMPPYALPDGATRSGIKSRSTGGAGPDNANEIRFEDKRGREELYVQAEKDHNVNVKAAQSITVGNDRTLSVGGNESVTVCGSRSLTVTGDDTETYCAAQTVSVGGTQTVGVTGAHSATFKAASTVSVTGASSFTATGARTGTFKGGRTDTVTGSDSVTVNGGRMATVHGVDQVTADVLWKASKGGSFIAVNDDITIVGTSAVSVICGGASVKVSGGNIDLTAPGTITLTVGGTTVQVAGGGVTVNGADVSITSDKTSIKGDPVKISK